VVRLKVPFVASAVGVPFRVRFQLTLFEVMVGVLQLALMPAGSPEAIAAVAPAPPEGTVTPPTPVAVTITEEVPIEDIDSELCDSDIFTPAVCARDVVLTAEKAINSKIISRKMPSNWQAKCNFIAGPLFQIYE
jgi:hypothetical protein